jgi:hypothetical protein
LPIDSEAGIPREVHLEASIQPILSQGIAAWIGEYIQVLELEVASMT